MPIPAPKLAGLALVAVLSMVPVAGFAQLDTYLQCTAQTYNASACTVDIVDEGNRELSKGVSESWFSEAGVTGKAYTATQSRAAYGNLGASIEADLQSSKGFGVGTNSYADVSFTDTLHVYSESLAFGTPVSVRLSGALVGQEVTTASLGPGYSQFIQRTLVAGLWLNNYGPVYHVGFGLTAPVEGVTPIDTPNYSFDYVLTTTVGANLELTGSLAAHVVTSISGLWVGGTPPGTGSLHESLLAYNSAHTYADAITPGVSLVAQSGVNYAAPVPEPSSYALFMVGVLALWAARYKAAPAQPRQTAS